MMTTEKVLLKAGLGQKTSRVPIWFLRQAGRYLPEYQEIRKNLDFVALCKNPKLASEVTLQPLRRFDLDAAIIFSDILIVAMALGIDLRFDKGHGPILTPPIRNSKDISTLQPELIADKTSFVGEALSLCKSALSATQTLIGFAGAPLTVASYMIEGKSSKDFLELKKMAYQDPKTLSALLEILAEATYHYLHMQVDAGADVLMLFDSWAHALPPHYYQRVIAPSLQELITRMKGSFARNVPLIYYPGQGMSLYHCLEGMPWDIIAVDWRNNLQKSCEILGAYPTLKAVQGNLDPQVLCFGSKDEILLHVDEIYQNLNAYKGKNPSRNLQHIFNVGHGLLPYTDPQKITFAIEAVRRWV